MHRRGLGLGHLTALAGAAGALESLWQPWYKAGVADPVIAGAVQTTGWLQLRHADQAFCAGAVLVVLLSLATVAGFDALAAGRWITILGGGGVALAAAHAIVRPLNSDLITPDTGLWVALGGSALAMLGGSLASQTSRPPAPAPATPIYRRPATPFLERSSSVPPPGA